MRAKRPSRREQHSARPGFPVRGNGTSHSLDGESSAGVLHTGHAPGCALPFRIAVNRLCPFA